MSKLQEYLDARREASLEELMELLRIPSVSTDPERKADVLACAEKVADRLREAGLTTEIHPTEGHPVVYGERILLSHSQRRSRTAGRQKGPRRQPRLDALEQK